MLATTLFGVTPDIRSHTPEVGYPKRMMGLEIEWDSADLPRFLINNLKWWDTRNEGSLGASGVELVFDKPLFGKDVRSALVELGPVIDTVRKVNSPNQSMHCHVDARNLSPSELLVFVLKAMAVEPLLFREFGPDREDNIFCLSLAKTRGSYFEDLVKLIAALRAGERVSYDFLSRYRYSAINLTSLSKFGSVEFRLADTTYSVAVMLHYMNTLDFLADLIEDTDIFMLYPDKIMETIHKVGDYLHIDEQEAQLLCSDTLLAIEQLLDKLYEFENNPVKLKPNPVIQEVPLQDSWVVG